MRELTDRLVKGNMNFPTLVDRVGSAVFGFISSLVVVGMVVIGFQNLDISAVILGFDRCPELEQPDEDLRLFPAADALVVSLMSNVSNNGFSGKQSFQQSHPDYLRELYLNRLVLAEGSRQECAPDAIAKTKRFWLFDTDHEIRDVKSGSQIEMGPDQRLCGVRVVLDTSKPSKKSIGSADVDGKVRFTMGSFRLVCCDPDEPKSESVALTPIGVLRSGGRLVDRFTPKEGKMLSSSTKEVDLLFRIPEIKDQPPQYLEYKRSARVPCPSARELLAARGPGDANLSGATVSKARLKLPGGGRTGGYILKEIEWVPRASAVPYGNIAIPRNALLEKEGIAVPAAFKHIHTDLLELPSQQYSTEYTPLAIPEGYGLVHLVLTSPRSKTDNSLTPEPVLVDLNDRQYPAVGFAVQGQISGKSYLEFAYSNRNAEGRTLTPGQGIPPGLSAPSKFFTRKGRAQKLSLFYLIPRGGKSMGLVGARMKDPTENKIQFWALEDGVDALVAPTR
jgi:hypothetical protein